MADWTDAQESLEVNAQMEQIATGAVRNVVMSPRIVSLW
jgi:hypothetical protein